MHRHSSLNSFLISRFVLVVSGFVIALMQTSCHQDDTFATPVQLYGQVSYTPPGGSPIYFKGVTVSVLDNNGALVRSVESEEQGYYELSGLPLNVVKGGSLRASHTFNTGSEVLSLTFSQVLDFPGSEDDGEVSEQLPIALSLPDGGTSYPLTTSGRLFYVPTPGDTLFPADIRVQVRKQGSFAVLADSVSTPGGYFTLASGTTVKETEAVVIETSGSVGGTPVAGEAIVGAAVISEQRTLELQPQ